MVFLSGIIFLIVGIAGVKELIQKKKNCTEKTTAIVTEIFKKIDYNNETSYWPIIEYDVNEKHFKNMLSTGNGVFQKYNVGKKIEIFYDKNNENEFYCEERYSYSLFWFSITTILGVLLIIFSINNKNA